MNKNTNDNELIVLVNDNGEVIKYAPKLASHNSNTHLHLAFSLYVFNNKGQFLATQRAIAKKVWPGVWTNSCCGHLSPNETAEEALVRRAQYELGLKVKDVFLILPDYRYRTPPFNGIIENEICPVYFAVLDSDIDINLDEVEAYKWIEWPEYVNELERDNQNKWSWWAKDQLEFISKLPNYLDIINKYTNNRY